MVFTGMLIGSAPLFSYCQNLVPQLWRYWFSPAPRRMDSGDRYDYVLTNPPFGKKFSITFTNEEGEQEDEDLVYNRQDTLYFYILFESSLYWTLTIN